LAINHEKCFTCKRIALRANGIAMTRAERGKKNAVYNKFLREGGYEGCNQMGPNVHPMREK